MTGAAYTPKPGTVAAKVVELLRTHGAPMLATEVCARMKQRPSNLGGNLLAAFNHGLVVKTRSEAGICYSLGNGKPTSDTPRKTRTPPPPAAVAPPEADAPLEIAIWHDGDVIVKGGTPIEAHNGGTAMAYSRTQAMQLVQMLTQPHYVLPQATA